MSLTPTQLGVLAIEAEWIHRVDRGAKSTAIRERLGLSETRYYQVLARLVEEPEAIAVEPVVLGVVRRRLAARRAYRSVTQVEPLVS